MPTHNDPHGHSGPKDFSKDEAALHSVGEGYELTDVSVGGVGVFLVALGITLVVFFVFAFGMGKVMNTLLRRNDGTPSPWQTAGPTALGGVQGKGMESSPVIEQKQLHDLTQAFPTPRLQTDDGDQDLADLHAREDLLLTNYSYIDPAQGKVRIPIDRAMELIAEHGLPVAPAQPGASGPTASAPLMFGDARPLVQVPLTSGFARTGYEQEQQMATRTAPAGESGQQTLAKASR